VYREPLGPDMLPLSTLRLYGITVASALRRPDRSFRFSGASTALPDDDERGLIGNLAGETNAHYGPAWPGVCRCWLPFGSPFGSPEALAGRISAPTSTIFVWLDAAATIESLPAGADVRFCRNEDVALVHAHARVGMIIRC
jgi:hypothetical protein